MYWTTLLFNALVVLQQVTQTDANATKYRDAWTSGDVFTAWLGPFADLLGPVFPLIAALGLAGIVSIYSSGFVMPIVTFILISGMLIPFLPAQAQLAAQGMLLLGVAYFLYHAWMFGGSRRL